MKLLRWLVFLATIIVLTACGSEPEPNPGDPLPNARNGLLAFYSGDVDGINTYFCEEILLSIRRNAPTPEREGRIDLSLATLEVVSSPSDNRRDILLTGEYAIWLDGQAEIRNTDELGAVVIGMVVEDGNWKICFLGSQSPEEE